jgi:hypothetical protein
VPPEDDSLRERIDDGPLRISVLRQHHQKNGRHKELRQVAPGRNRVVESDRLDDPDFARRPKVHPDQNGVEPPSGDGHGHGHATVSVELQALKMIEPRRRRSGNAQRRSEDAFFSPIWPQASVLYGHRQIRIQLPVGECASELVARAGRNGKHCHRKSKKNAEFARTGAPALGIRRVVPVVR